MKDEQFYFGERQKVLAEHQGRMDKLHRELPELADLERRLAGIRKVIISKMLATYQGQGPDPELVNLEAELAEAAEARLTFLKQHGISEEMLTPKWKCHKCEDTGRIYSEEDRIQLCDCRQQLRSSWKRQMAGLPPRLASATFAGVNYDLYRNGEREQVRKLFNYVEQYCERIGREGQGGGLFIHGCTGSGKSWLLGCIANHMASELSVKYMVFADFLDTLRATFSGNNQSYSEQELIEYVKQVDLLLLDDLGVEKASEFSLKYLAQIIDYRYRYLKPVVVTSNFTLEELRNRTQSDLYGERIVWRLIETCDILNLEGNIRLRL